MKNKLKLVAIIVFAVLLFPIIESCKKYDDGPTISLRSRSERISNTWVVENYKINGTDFTSLVSNYTETFSKNKDYSYSWAVLNGSGTWTLQNSDEEIKLNGSDAQSSRTLFILKLEETAFWYYYMNGTDKHELHFVSN